MVKNIFERRRRRDAYKYSGTNKPVLGVFRSNKHLSAYLRDGSTIVFTVSTNSKDVPEDIKAKNNIASSHWVGSKVSEKLKSMNIHEIVFNKSGYKFHGRVAEVARTIRESGIKC